MTKFTHTIADQLEAEFPVHITQWGIQGATAVAVNKGIDEDEETKIIHEAASWLREHGFADIRFETGHDHLEDKPVLVLRHPWDEEGETDLDEDSVIAMVKAGKIEEATKLLVSRTKEAQVSMTKEAQDIPLTQVDDKLSESYDALAEALTHLDEMVFILGEYDSQGALDEETSDLAHDLTTQVETLSVQALEVKKIIDKIDANID